MELDLRHHRHALALAEHRHFQRAARSLGISQPALSRSIQELERRLGVVLFTRSRDGADATDLGRIFLARARAVLGQAADLEREMLLAQGVDAGELRVGAGVYPSEMFVAAAIARMASAPAAAAASLGTRGGRRAADAQAGPKLTIVSNGIDVLLQMLRRREIDLAIGDLRTAEADRAVSTTPLSWHRGYLTVRSRHPLLSVPRPSMRDVLRYPLALTTRIPPDLLSHFLEGKGTRRSAPSPLPAITADSPTVMKTIVSASDAVTLMPMSLIASELRDRTLATLPIEAPWLGRTFAIIQLTDRTPSPAAERFMQHVIELDARAAAMTAPRGRRG